MVSTISSAGCPAASIAARTSSMRLVQPVEVSLCTTHTALIRWSRSCASAAPMAATSAPRRQSVSMNIASRPSFSAMSFHRVANQPVRHIRTVSPGDSVLVSAASHAPVPEAG